MEIVTDTCARNGERSHGEAYRPTAEYRAWAAMLVRCYSTTSRGYELWGGRGITVCDRWRHSYENFLADMGRRPSPLHSLDRRDNDCSYEPDNCRWATRTEQNRNRRNNHRLAARGECLTLAEWSERYGVPHNTIRGRLATGWDIESAVSTPALTRSEVGVRAARAGGNPQQNARGTPA